MINFVPQMSRMIRYLLFIASLMLSMGQVQGQPGSRNAGSGDLLMHLQEEASGQVHMEVDSLLVSNYYKLLTMNSKESGVPGFRIRIYSESGLGAKEEQQRIRAMFLSYYPDIDAYYRYDEPFFKVYVGDCRTKSEALKIYDRIKKNFPNPIIVPDYINIKSTQSQSH